MKGGLPFLQMPSGCKLFKTIFIHVLTWFCVLKSVKMTIRQIFPLLSKQKTRKYIDTLNASASECSIYAEIIPWPWNLVLGISSSLLKSTQMGNPIAKFRCSTDANFEKSTFLTAHQLKELPRSYIGIFWGWGWKLVNDTCCCYGILVY